MMMICLDKPELAVTPLGNRLYRLIFHSQVKAITDDGTLVFDFDPGFVTNFRSGGPVVDKFVDQVGDGQKALCYLIHDAMYTPCEYLGYDQPVSRKVADVILRDSLIWAGMPKWKANIVYMAVRMFGGPAYNNDDEFTRKNSKLFRFHWSDK